MIKTLPKSAKKLLEFLKNKSIHTFEDTDGKPDIFLARKFKEDFCELHKDYLDYIVIEQTYNKVTISRKEVP